MVKVGGDNRDFGIPFCVRSCIHKISRENNIILHSKFCAKTYHRQTFPVLYFCTEKQDMGNWACYINVLIRWKTWIADVLVHCMTGFPPTSSPHLIQWGSLIQCKTRKVRCVEFLIIHYTLNNEFRKENQYVEQ